MSVLLPPGTYTVKLLLGAAESTPGQQLIVKKIRTVKALKLTSMLSRTIV